MSGLCVTCEDATASDGEPDLSGAALVRPVGVETDTSAGDGVVGVDVVAGAVVARVSVRADVAGLAVGPTVAAVFGAATDGVSALLSASEPPQPAAPAMRAMPAAATPSFTRLSTFRMVPRMMPLPPLSSGRPVGPLKVHIA